ncbi:hypothetical protein [Gymnodinialimonas sp. 57CJ19]|uniref:hypothetical protein n=1 Tax=Gymnodinialimonas sp. 57CJ19 TaxID=3138498 RepID=UPI00313436BA
MTQRLSDLSGHAYGSSRFPTSISEVPTYLANIDPMTAGLILLAACAAYLVWSGNADERARHSARQRSGKGITLPPPIVPKEFLDRANRTARD